MTITESLSALHILTAAWVAGAWGIVDVAFAIYGWKSLEQIKDSRHIGTGRVSPFTGFILAGIGFIVAATGVIALVAPPNTYDSLTYHMPRVMQWIQHQSVGHYPTHTPMQLHRPPWAEFAILHLQLLSHGDRFANLVQWLSMVGSLVGISLITKQLGGNTLAQVTAVVLTATLPMGILQSSSTQTDYVAAFWLVCFVCFALAVLTDRQPGRRGIVLMGASLGLAILTKPTAYLYAFPFLLWLGVAGVCKYGSKRILALLAVAVIAVLLNLGHYWRNYDLFSSPMGPTGSDLCSTCSQVNEGWTLPLFLSNVVRNVSLHLGTPFDSLNRALNRITNAFHSLMGITTNDPRITWMAWPFWISPTSFDENSEGNLFHAILIGFACLCLLGLKRIRSSPLLIPYAFGVVAGFLVFCLIVKWNPYNSRLHLTLFILWAPLIGLALVNLHAPFARAVLALAIVLSIPWVVFNNARPLLVPPFRFVCHFLPDGQIGCMRSPDRRLTPTIFSGERYQLYFLNQPELVYSYTAAANKLLEHRCSQIGLVKHWNEWEYPVWTLMEELGSLPVRIENMAVTNASKIFSLSEPYRSFQPCAILSIFNGQVTVQLTDSGAR